VRIERVLVANGSEFRVVGQLDSTSCRQLQRMLAGPASDGGVVTLDLSELRSCDAAGIDVLVNLTKRAEIASGELLLRSASADVRQAFLDSNALAKLHVTPVFEDTEPGAHAPR
jgi:anti-anti-sigma factor